MRGGTELFILGTLSLTLPSIVSQYYRQLGLQKPLLSRLELTSLYFHYSTWPHFQILSKPFTILSHLFVHADWKHWLGNMISLTLYATSLDLGFLPSCILFLGGGLSGLCWHLLIEVWLKKEVKTLPEPLLKKVQEFLPSVLNWFKEKLVGFTYVKPSLPITLCGASASVFAFFGSTLFLSLFKLKREWTIWRESRQANLYNYHCLRFFTALESVLAPSASLLMQIYYSSLTRNTLTDLSLPCDIAYSAHVGGFLFGILGTFVFVDSHLLK